MATAIQPNIYTKAAATIEEPSYCVELLTRIQAIWHAVCAWISQFFDSKPVSVISEEQAKRYDMSQSSPDAFYKILSYLSPEEVGGCEQVCKFWKMPDNVWKTRALQEGITSMPICGNYKALFNVPKMAFGPRQWIKYGWGEPGSMPPLPANISALAKERENTHTLTLIPSHVNGTPFCLKAFAEMVKKYTNDFEFIIQTRKETYKCAPQEKSVWVWMEKNLDLNTLGISRKEAAQKYQLVRSLWIVVSVYTHYARSKDTLFFNSRSQVGHVFVHTSDEIVFPEYTWEMFVGGIRERLLICPSPLDFEKKLGAINTFAAE